ncbi:MAG: hypothetical protein U1F54_22155 [Burkholderiales bacterium]
MIELAGVAANGATRARGSHCRRAAAGDQGLRRQVPEGIQVQERPQRHEGLQRRVRRQGHHGEEQELRQQGVRQGAPRRQDLGQGLPRRAARRDVRRQGRPRSRELPRQGRQRQAGRHRHRRLPAPSNRHASRRRHGDFVQPTVSGTATARSTRSPRSASRPVAGGGRDQPRAGRVRLVARVHDAVLHRGRRAVALVPAHVRGRRRGVGRRVQAADRRSADQARRHPAGDRHPRPVHRGQVLGARGLQCRGPSVPQPFPAGQLSLAGINVSYADIGTLFAGAIVVGLQAFLNKTVTGRAMQAVAQNTEAAKVLGIDAKRMVLYVFVINAVLAVVAAMLITPTYLAKFDMGDSIGQKAFFAAIIGGFNQTRGALLGGVLIGILENLVGFYISPAYKEGVALVLFMLVILFRPEGLLGKSEERKV